ncbi:hypothetical protein M7I_3582 [Glarea lozoyensis 74030]|uniref:Uncharacterized protein n=1 Tax=Glarea lozoyensis (strain ATCC 74030 / MF5533) TaxID=1104152 RepID=H0ELV9_GLAL7|nr:hypothetical protein M7I_3582 [Glarea lozoyensis 74030]
MKVKLLDIQLWQNMWIGCHVTARQRKRKASRKKRQTRLTFELDPTAAASSSPGSKLTPAKVRYGTRGKDGVFAVRTPPRKISFAVESDATADSDIRASPAKRRHTSNGPSNSASNVDSTPSSPVHVTRKITQRKRHRTQKEKELELMKLRRAGDKNAVLPDSESSSEEESDAEQTLEHLSEFEDEEEDEEPEEPKVRPSKKGRGPSKIHEEDDDNEEEDEDDFIIEDDDGAIGIPGKTYNKETLEEIEQDDGDDSDEQDSGGRAGSVDGLGRRIAPEDKEFLTGRFCRAKAQKAHLLSHWRYHLYDWVRGELENEPELAPERVLKHRKLKPWEKRDQVEAIIERWENNGKLKGLYRDYNESVSKLGEIDGGSSGRWG